MALTEFRHGRKGGELKHGVIALIEPGTPCLVLAPHDETFSAILSGAQEIKARGGHIIGISPSPSEVWDEHIQVADVGEAAVFADDNRLLRDGVFVLRGALSDGAHIDLGILRGLAVELDGAGHLGHGNDAKPCRQGEGR